MCLDVTRKTKMRIAKEDMIVYKKGVRRDKGSKFGSSCHRYFSYEKDVLQPKVKLVKQNPYEESYTREINKGYHFFFKKPENVGMGKVLGIFFIPEGTGYYQDKIGLVGVAETIKFIDFEKMPRHRNWR